MVIQSFDLFVGVILIIISGWCLFRVNNELLNRMMLLMLLHLDVSRLLLLGHHLRLGGNVHYVLTSVQTVPLLQVHSRLISSFGCPSLSAWVVFSTARLTPMSFHVNGLPIPPLGTWCFSRCHPFPGIGRRIPLWPQRCSWSAYPPWSRWRRAPC